MSGLARGGDDIVTGTGSLAFLTGDAGTMSGYTRAGNDVLTGSGLNRSFLYGDAEVMSGHARGGNDVLTGNGPENFLFGDARTLSDFARGGNDRLISGPGSDHMYGDGATVADTVRTGRDTFVLGRGSGQDVIYDFEQGQDRIELDGTGQSFITLAIDVSDIDGNGTMDSILRFDAADSVTVLGVAQLTPADFLFLA
jgi:Ca2+-binding RTX toxin-like protein